MPDPKPDIFSRHILSIPKEKQFKVTTLPELIIPLYERWKKQHNLTESPDYDLAGAFASGAMPRDGHLPSFGLEGRHLKSPAHPTIWKTSYTELIRQITKKDPDPKTFPKTREEAIARLHLLRGMGGIRDYYGAIK